MVVTLEELTERYFDRAIARGEILFDAQTCLPILDITSVLEHPDTLIEDWETLGNLVGIKLLSAKINLSRSDPWLFDEDHNTTTGKVELYAYLKAKRSVKGAEKRKSDLKATLHRLVEYEHSYPLDSSGILLEEGYPSAPRGTDYPTQQGRALRQLLGEKAREYPFYDSTYVLPIKSTANKHEVADVLGVNVDIINKMRTNHPSYFRGDTLEIRDLVQLVIDYVEQMVVPSQPRTKLQRLTLYLGNITAFVSRIGESGPATDSVNRGGKDNEIYPMQAIVEGLKFDPRYHRVEAYVRREFPDDTLALRLTAELIQRGAQGISWAYIDKLSQQLGVQSGRVNDTLEALYSRRVAIRKFNQFKLNPKIMQP